MNLSSSVLKERAKVNLKSNLGEAILICLIPTLLMSVLSGFSGAASAVKSIFMMAASGAGELSPTFLFTALPGTSISGIAGLLLNGAFTIGTAAFFLHLADKNNPNIRDIFSRFKPYGNTVLMNLLTTLFTVLWSLLFIIPGIVAGYSYSLTPYILAEHPEMPAMDAIKMSKNMMKGNKGKLFMLDLSFIGWFFLCILSCGIGFIFLSPYWAAARAEFFNEVSGKNFEKQQNAGQNNENGNTQYGQHNGNGNTQYGQYGENGNTQYGQYNENGSVRE